MPLRRSFRIMTIGSGAREDAINWKLSQSRHKPELYAVPGNAGTLRYAQNLGFSDTYPAQFTDFARREDVKLTIVGSEVPLSLGIVDVFRERGMPIFGPTKKAARIETSKLYAEEQMRRAGIVHPETRRFFRHTDATDYFQSTECAYPLVVKRDGLCGGKGVWIATNAEEATIHIHEIPRGEMFQVQRFIAGKEYSAHAIADAHTHHLFPLSRDYKKLHDGNRGPNTGGMGAIAPATNISTALIHEIAKNAVGKMLQHLTDIGTPFTGCLYPGIMVAENSNVHVLEYNVRFGDPETSVYMRLLNTDLADLLIATATGRLNRIPQLKWKREYAVCIVLASAGYGELPDTRIGTGYKITGISDAEQIPGVVVFHAGTFQKGSGSCYTAGGRVLNVTATGHTLREATRRAYQAVKKISFRGMHYRTDIGTGMPPELQD